MTARPGLLKLIEKHDLSMQIGDDFVVVGGWEDLRTMSRSIHVDWSDETFTGQIDFTCPFCDEGRKSFSEWLDSLSPERFKEFREEFEGEQKEKDAEASDDEFNSWLEEKWSEDDDSACGECDGQGHVEPVMNYAYLVPYTQCGSENRRKALLCGLFLFEHPGDGEVYMSLCGGGMDLSPNILLAYLELLDYIPYEWVEDFRSDYRANLSEAEHRRIGKACVETLRRTELIARDQKRRIRDWLYPKKERPPKKKPMEENSSRTARIEVMEPYDELR